MPLQRRGGERLADLRAAVGEPIGADKPAKIISSGTMKSMMGGQTDRDPLRDWVETWRRAGPELAEIRRREIESVDTREAVRQIFGSSESLFRNLQAPTTSGLVEQQAWFAKLRR